MSEEQGISLRFIRDLERKDGIRQEVLGWWIGGGSAETFSERTEKALEELGRLGPPKP